MHMAFGTSLFNFNRPALARVDYNLDPPSIAALLSAIPLAKTAVPGYNTFNEEYTASAQTAEPLIGENLCG